MKNTTAWDLEFLIGRSAHLHLREIPALVTLEALLLFEKPVAATH